MKMTFEGETLADVIASIGDFLKDYTTQSNIIAHAAEETPEPTRRKRRTKAEMEAAKADATPDTSSEATPEPTTRRRRARAEASATTTAKTSVSSSDEKPDPTTRRRRRSAPSAEDASKAAPARRRRGTATSPSSDIKDKDLVKGASTLAQATNPGVVKALLEEFGVAKVQDLEGDARREFLTAATELAEDE